ncbi:MAG: YraN family protein, partial [Desulfovibrio sp.]|nr:YraN family protein [Desulfovibrio sp.]
RKGRLELDIVCRDGDTIVFVEVKTRNSSNYGGPASGLTPSKCRTLCRAATAWLASHNAWSHPCRFDVICLVRQGNVLYPEHYRHAFSCESPVDRCHTHWQPW